MHRPADSRLAAPVSQHVSAGDGRWQGTGLGRLMSQPPLVEHAGAGAGTDARLGDSIALRWLLFAMSCVLVTVPFACVEFPPITDLPQHLAQVRLLGAGTQVRAECGVVEREIGRAHV